ncbi:inactive beta-amylase 4, chloroplastic isoform X2 [Benincasa hispida]|uniref:inactive beta-amylase 4, chloroplastic isoform X2 n=1 Tax=Benincasa hispida TaxID=102211 RepID=UPI001901E848|nr:inactive beta-amylase 4, chloroplastic isoform X2 [Benincasa hispida]
MAMAEAGGLVYRYPEMRSCFPRQVRLQKTNLHSFSTNPLYRIDFVNRRRLSSRNNNCIISMDAREKSRRIIVNSSRPKTIPVYVMLPVDIFDTDPSGDMRIKKMKAIRASLRALKLAGVHGVAVEVWWGVVERFTPWTYNWSLYEGLFKSISETGLKLHAALSFHSDMRSTSKGKEGVSLPLWILEVGARNKDIYYQDQKGRTNDDYLTLGVDDLPLFCGRTALQCYEDFISNFVTKFDRLIGDLIQEISIGLGPSGELRYPAHPFNDGRWKFPGIGEFQCYDKYMLAELKTAARQIGKPQWGNRGPRNAGDYNSLPSGAPFFVEGEGSFLSEYGHFFLEWYSERLIHHADAILGKAAQILKKFLETKHPSVLLVAKLGGIYWWYKTFSHAAELTAGYYNTDTRDGYDPVTSMLSRHGAALHFPCLEMRDTETPLSCFCSPEGLLKQIVDASEQNFIHLTGRNTKERFDKAGFWQIHTNCCHPGADAVKSFTYFRMTEKIFWHENWNNFVPFIKMMSTSG